jgi:hypothetical protein
MKPTLLFACLWSLCENAFSNFKNAESLRDLLSSSLDYCNVMSVNFLVSGLREMQ